MNEISASTVPRQCHICNMASQCRYCKHWVRVEKGNGDQWLPHSVQGADAGFEVKVFINIFLLSDLRGDGLKKTGVSAATRQYAFQGCKTRIAPQ